MPKLKLKSLRSLSSPDQKFIQKIREEFIGDIKPSSNLCRELDIYHNILEEQIPELATEQQYDLALNFERKAVRLNHIRNKLCKL